MNDDRWLLPEGIDELLPAEAQCLETLRRRLLDLFATWGYQLVIPPFVEYTESLLTGMGRDLDLQTFKLIDQRNGRMMGVRADMTPQVARIDAHRIGAEEPQRLCYIGTVLRTRGDDFTHSRNIMQVGAELFGHAGVESDIELLNLMIAMLKTTGINDIYLDLGHVNVFRGLSRQAGLNEQQKAMLFGALQRKAAPEIETLLEPIGLDSAMVEMLSGLVGLNGEQETIEEARLALKSATDSVHQALDDLERIAEHVSKQNPEIQIHYDLAEVRGLSYHTGVVFSTYQLGVGQAIAQGGRYDDIGQVFGRSRPATGFSADLRQLMGIVSMDDIRPAGIFAPHVDDIKLQARIKALRAAGERVVCALPGQIGGAHEMGCDKILTSRDGVWRMEELNRS